MTYIPSPTEILGRHQQEFLNRCAAAIQRFNGTPIEVSLLDVDRAAVEYAIGVLGEHGWWARERRPHPGYPVLVISAKL